MVNIINGTANGDLRSGTDAADNMFGFAGNDTLLANGGNDYVDGGAGRDTLSGGDGNDTLVGGAGINYLYGGAGNDVALYTGNRSAYTVTFVNDVIGTVGIKNNATGEYDVLVGVERAQFADASLALTATVPVSPITGTTGNDTLTGTSGNDTISGLAGNDALYGGAGNDRLIGGAGNDTLQGDAGKDVFVFDQAIAPRVYDKIVGYSAVDDTIALDHNIFTAFGLGTISAAAFKEGTAASTVNQHIIHDSATGKLYYDADGVGGLAKVQFATLDVGLHLTNADFIVE